MELSGNVTLDSSSFFMDSQTNSLDSFYVERVSISSGSNNLTSIFNNAHVIHLTLIGEYKIIINSTGPVTYHAWDHSIITSVFRFHLDLTCQ